MWDCTFRGFFLDVPGIPVDSFFTGQAFVINKDKVTQPSTAIRHATEFACLVQANYGIAKPTMVVVSDGGPDHRVTFGSVKVANLCIFQVLDLDMLVCVRTCPYQSWQNIAERVMSTLNFALQNVSFACSKMLEELEALICNKNTLENVCTLIEQRPELREALCDSMASVKIALSQHFQSIKIKSKAIKVGIPATEAEMTELFSHSAL